MLSKFGTSLVHIANSYNCKLYLFWWLANVPLDQKSRVGLDYKYIKIHKEVDQHTCRPCAIKTRLKLFAVYSNMVML